MLFEHRKTALRREVTLQWNPDNVGKKENKRDGNWPRKITHKSSHTWMRGPRWFRGPLLAANSNCTIKHVAYLADIEAACSA